MSNLWTEAFLKQEKKSKLMKLKVKCLTIMENLFLIHDKAMMKLIFCIYWNNQFYLSSNGIKSNKNSIINKKIILKISIQSYRIIFFINYSMHWTQVSSLQVDQANTTDPYQSHTKKVFRYILLLNWTSSFPTDHRHLSARFLN